MSKIEEIIKEKCPNGVDFYPLGEVCTVVRGASPRPIKNFITEEIDSVNWIKIGDVAVGSKYITSCAERITREGAKKSRFVKKGDFILSNSMSFGRPYILEIDGCIHDGWLAISDFEDKMITDYLYYVLVSGNIQREMEHRASFGGAVQNLNADIVRAIEIPVPPIEVQQEIVRILDKFTALDAGLNDELNNRRKQYLYAMDELVAHRADVMDITVGDAFDIITDYTAAGSFADLAKNVIYSDSPDYAQLVRTMDIKSKFTKGSPVYVSESAFKYLWRVNLDSEAVILPNIGANCGEVYYVVPEDLPYENNVLGPNAILARSTKYNNRYLAYTLQTPEFQRQLRKIISPAGQTKFNKTDLKKLTIKVPSIEEQEKIVEVLDRFDVLCNDSKLGLPAEIEARRKQYEYYRDKLLTFERKVV